MRLRLFSAPARHPQPVAGDGLLLRPPETDDFPVWRQLRADSAAFLTPWEPRWPPDDLTRAGFRRRLSRYQAEADSGSAYSYFLFAMPGETLLGGLSLANIRMGAARTASLGDWMGERHAGHGYMTKAVRLVLAQAFGAFGLERVEAGCLPENARSTGLLEAVGFRREGLMRGYLEIDGRRRDHVLYAILREDHAAAAAGKG